MNRTVVSVSDVNQYIKAVLDRDHVLGSLCVRGELSNYKMYGSGHHYFTLKDENSAIRCVMFKGNAMRLRFRPENGMKVIVDGRISVFPKDGAYQLYCNALTPEGAGDLHIAFEQLKSKLSEEGLFDPRWKKPLPDFPKRIAIITSADGAAVHDMLRILSKRFPMVQVRILSVRVQGVEAPAEICGAIRYANRFRLGDVIITGRGGGSLEDLWAFNDERVARAIHESEIPVISAVGHEPDVTISDYVADLRAATPSNAAELVVPDQKELLSRIHSLSGRLQQAVDRQLKSSRQNLTTLQSKRVLQSPLNYIQDKRLLVDYQQTRLDSAMQECIGRNKQQMVRLAAGLDAMSPLKVLARGYSMVRNECGEVLTETDRICSGDRITVTLHKGEIEASVLSVKGENSP